MQTILQFPGLSLKSLPNKIDPAIKIGGMLLSPALSTRLLQIRCVMQSQEEDGKKKFTKRDELLDIEKKVQSWWEEEKIFEAKAHGNSPKPWGKFFGTFPYPYMNGLLHLGHAFSLSKLEFSAAYHRLKGDNVLVPFAFHGTGMPIKAAADKLAREVQEFGCPPVFPKNVEQGKQEGEEKCNTAGAPPGKKHKGKKSKVGAKETGEEYQWLIMQKGSGLTDSEIEKLQDPKEWLTFFPPKAVEVLRAFGLGCDWRRSFITTDMNPFYDAFVKWQVRKLKSMGKIVKDFRYTIYSPKDGQPCADHERASGEGVQPQEYTVIKMEVMAPFPSQLGVLEGRNVFLAATVLGPETIYGQTNAYVLPDGKYGAYEINETDVLILTRRAALNLAYQNYSRVPEKPTCLVEMNGHDLIGLPLKSPLAQNQVVYALPMLTIQADNGTGIVTSLPADAPELKAWHDLNTKRELREKHGVREEWIIRCEGRKNEEVEPLTRRSKLLEAGEAFIYSEPEQRVVSRSGEECIVALTDQWYITYGEAEWKKLTEECLSSMNLYSNETRRGFEHTLGWLNQWACSRSFGLGTRIPWDEEFLVESLSDSTIYMAYYTIAHFLHNGNMYDVSNSKVRPEHMTDEVWEYIFCEGPKPESNSEDDASIFDEMKQEFEYWYPFDLRVSGKDLIQNHLTFCIYNHVAIMAKKHWPRGFRCNGHLELNAKKMSKATGNFKTLANAIEEYSADATRFSLADTGDGVENANFEYETANAAILRLTKEMEWMKEVLKQEPCLRTGPPSTFADRVFANEINIAIDRTEKNYQAYMFREALKTGVYDLQAARDEYRFSCGTLEGMNRDLVRRFMEVQTCLITPICPHYAEHVWRKILNKDGFVVKAGWPVADAPDLTLRIANKYLQASIVLIKKLLHKQSFKKVTNGHRKQIRGLIYVNEQFDGWQAKCLTILKRNFDSDRRSFSSDIDKLIHDELHTICVGECKDLKGKLKECMPFIKLKKSEAVALGLQALELRLPFGEIEFLRDNLDWVRRQVGLEEVHVLSASNHDDRALAGCHAELIEQNPPVPGRPTAVFIE